MPHKKICNYLSKEIHSIFNECHGVPSVREIKHLVHLCTECPLCTKCRGINNRSIGMSTKCFVSLECQEENTRYNILFLPRISFLLDVIGMEHTVTYTKHMCQP
jgi:hypothetical protein